MKEVITLEDQGKRALTSGRLFQARNLVTRATDLANLLSNEKEKKVVLKRLEDRTIEVNRILARAKHQQQAEQDTAQTAMA